MHAHIRSYTKATIQLFNYGNFLPQANYGRSDEGCVEKVKAVYESLNLLKLFMEYEEQCYQSIKMLINKHTSEILPACIFNELNDEIYVNRTKYFHVRVILSDDV